MRPATGSSPASATRADYEHGRAGRGTRGARRAAHRRGGRGGGGGRRRRRFRWIAPLVALLVIVVPLAVGGIYAYGLYMNKYHPADYSGRRHRFGRGAGHFR